MKIQLTETQVNGLIVLVVGLTRLPDATLGNVLARAKALLGVTV